MELWDKHPIVIVEITHKIRTFLKTLASSKATTWRLTKSQSNDELLSKAMSSRYHIEQKKFIEASRTNNIHTRKTLEKWIFAATTFKDLRVASSQTKLKNVW